MLLPRYQDNDRKPYSDFDAVDRGITHDRLTAFTGMPLAMGFSHESDTAQAISPRSMALPYRIGYPAQVRTLAVVGQRDPLHAHAMTPKTTSYRNELRENTFS